jgi:iron complex outermembrane receptor protein
MGLLVKSNYPIFYTWRNRGGAYMKKIISVILVCFILEAATAQNAVPPEAEGGDSLDFVVTAGRTREEAAKVSAQMTVITAEDIAESGATTVVDVLETAPGVRISRDASGMTYDVSMRGMSSVTGGASVLILVDGMRINPVKGTAFINWDAVNLSEVERIEILDGGASVQYGDNAKAGVINIITKKSGKAATDIVVSGGSFFQNEQRLSHHQPMDWGGFTISGGHRGTQGYQKHSAFDTGHGELRGFWDMNDSMSLNGNVGFSFTNAIFGGSLGMTKEQFEDDPTQNSDYDYFSSNDPGSNDNGSNMDVNMGLGFAWGINDILTFDMPISYDWDRIGYNTQNSASPVALKMTQQMSGARPKVTAELKPAGMGLRLIGGADMFLALYEIKNTGDFVKESNPQAQTVTEFTIGPYALVNFEPFSFLSVNAGLRYDAAFISAKQHAWSGETYDPGSGGMIPVDSPEYEEPINYNAFVYEGGITVNPLDFLKVYAKYGTHFRYPYLDDFPVASYNPSIPFSLNTDIEPEKGWTAEGGIGLNFKGITRFNANFYYFKMENEILQTPAYQTLNMDPIERMGTNIDLNVRPVKYVELDAAYGFVNAVFSEGPYKDKSVPLVPQHTLSASIMAHFPFGLSFGPDVAYKSEFYPGRDYANTEEIVDSALIWGLTARYAKDVSNGELAIVVTAHNLLDTKYTSMAYYFDFSAYGIPAFTGYYVDNNMGRSVNVSLQYRF